ncbi:MAG TPA: phosphopantetheine-binding protein [Vicinamibacterales bacterium]|nr:phosphopantetheine-binding protein [Vicinamibacterales bacterium]
MTRDEIRDVVLQALTKIAPEVDPASIAPAVSLRDQLDLDSIDFLNVVLAIHERLGVEIPEADYAKLLTLNGAVTYLTARQAAPRQ